MSVTSNTNGVELKTTFARDVELGLCDHPKKLPSKYFYDQKGDELFQAIMRMPEYYLTGSEYQIFKEQKAEILEAFGWEPFDLIELGAGDGYKTKVLLSYFLDRKVPFIYRPVDISRNVLQLLKEDLEKQWPELKVRPLNGDYFKMLGRLHQNDTHRKIVLFLGANIGNYTRDQASTFLNKLRRQLDPGDLLLIGFDLRKEPSVILQAYNDPAGITAAFNINLLRRINRELGADFNLAQFRHWETYNPVSGAAKSYLVSLQDQEVEIKALCQSFPFQAWEAIEVELSLKYSTEEIEQLAETAGFYPVRHFFDDKRYFVDSLWVVR